MVRRQARLIESSAGLVMIVVGVTFLRIVHGTPAPYGDPWEVGSAAFFPGLIALLVTGLGVVQLLSAWRPGLAIAFESGHTARALTAYALMVATALSIKVLGIWLVAMLAVPLMAICFGERRWYLLLVLAVVPPTLVIHLFEGVMGVYFPRGVLF